MVRTSLAVSLLAGLLAYASDALACTPSPSRFLVPTGVLTDPSQPIARDAGFYFVGEQRESYALDSGFEIVVTDNATGSVVQGSPNGFRPWLDGDHVLAWIPLQPLAASSTYTIKVNPVPVKQSTQPSLMPLPPVTAMQAIVTTSADLLPAIEIAGAPRVTLRTETRLPLRCQGPCAGMSGPCAPTSLLMADVEIPEIDGGAVEQGYEVGVTVRYGKTSREDYYELSDFKRIDARTPGRISLQAMEYPEPVEICVQLQLQDIARHTASSPPICGDAQTVAATLRKSGAAKGGPAQAGAAGSASEVMRQPGAPTRHVSACAVALQDIQRADRSVLAAPFAIAMLSLLRRRWRSRER